MCRLDSLEWFMGWLTTGQSAGGSSLHLRCYFGYFGHFGNTLGTPAAWGATGVLGAWFGVRVDQGAAEKG